RPHSLPRHRSRPHPARHSFPTRRSSDLSRACAALREDQIVVSVLLQQVRSLRRPLLISVPEKSCLGDLLRKIFIQLQNSSAAVQDRKSTRLNSSHVSISYAVFCLKKKNK